MRLIIHYLKYYKGLLVGALVLATINQVFSLFDPQIFRLIIDRYASHGDQYTSSQFLSGVLLLLAGSVGVALVSRIAKNFQDYFVNVITQRIGTRMYADSVSHSFLLPYVVFEDQRSGELLRKLEKARQDTQALITSTINMVFFALVGILFVTVYAFYVYWLIGVVYGALIPAFGVVTFVLSRKIRAAQRSIVARAAELAGSTTETIRNVELVKSLGLEQQEINRLNDVNDAILQLELYKVRLIRTFSFIQGTLINTMRSALMLLLLWLIFRQTITLGEFFTLYIYSFFIFGPLGELGNVATQYQEARASMGMLAEVFAMPPEPQPENPQHVGRLETIRFESVGFTYPTGHKPALEDITVEATAGQTIAFVGPSGSGKTTLVKLLVGLYRPTKGRLLINTIDSLELDRNALRKRVGLVAQDTQLFAGTIRENLHFVSPTATDQECLDVMASAAADSILARGGQGLDTKIGEGGLKLSGGERQRLAIARALLRQPDLIIFDEATSSLDSLTEQSITQTIKSIEQVRPGLITIMVAHRLSTIAHAQVIYVLEKGRIVEQGTHDSLVAAGSLYAALWRQQIASKDSDGSLE